ncbi:hypothetical protein GDO86_009218 [Hymenochirus boettgeri]|nr:hypothetical protein GDO86_009218 [Hymenochirus boettgeri]
MASLNQSRSFANMLTLQSSKLRWLPVVTRGRGGVIDGRLVSLVTLFTVRDTLCCLIGTAKSAVSNSYQGGRSYHTEERGIERQRRTEICLSGRGEGAGDLPTSHGGAVRLYIL